MSITRYPVEFRRLELGIGTSGSQDTDKYYPDLEPYATGSPFLDPNPVQFLPNPNFNKQTRNHSLQIYNAIIDICVSPFFFYKGLLHVLRLSPPLPFFHYFLRSTCNERFSSLYEFFYRSLLFILERNRYNLSKESKNLNFQPFS